MYNDVKNAMHTPLPASEKAVLAVYADCADDKGITYPDIQTLVSRTGMSERQVYRSKKQLAQQGHIQRTGNGVLEYQLCLEEAAEFYQGKAVQRVQHSGLPTHQRLVLMAHAKHANHKDECWLKGVSISGLTGLSRAAIYKAKTKLVQGGYITKVYGRKFCTYTVDLSNLPVNENCHMETQNCQIETQNCHMETQELTTELTKEATSKEGSPSGSPEPSFYNQTESTEKGVEAMSEDEGKKPVKKLSAKQLAQPVGEGGKVFMAKKTHGGSPTQKACKLFRELLTEYHNQKALQLTAKQKGQVKQYIRKFEGDDEEAIRALVYAIKEWNTVRDFIGHSTGENIKAAVPTIGLLLKYASEVATAASIAGGEGTATTPQPKPATIKPQEAAIKAEDIIVEQDDLPMTLEEMQAFFDE